MKDIPGYEGLYAACEDGRIWAYPRERSSKLGMFLKPSKMKNGYLRVSLSRKKVKTYLVHRLIALAYIPNVFNLPQVNHKDGNRGNNRLENLEWVNNSGNMQNAIERGSFNRKGARHPLSKLTDIKVRWIRKAWESHTLNQYEIAKKFDVSQGLIHQIYRRKIWQHIT